MTRNGVRVNLYSIFIFAMWNKINLRISIFAPRLSCDSLRLFFTSFFIWNEYKLRGGLKLLLDIFNVYTTGNIIVFQKRARYKDNNLLPALFARFLLLHKLNYSWRFINIYEAERVVKSNIMNCKKWCCVNCSNNNKNVALTFLHSIV